MLEQIFILQKRDGTIAVEYIGVRSIEDYVTRSALDSNTRLAEFETLLVSQGFRLADSSEEFHLRIWTRSGKQLALNGDKDA